MPAGAEEDWLADSEGRGHLNYRQFFNSMFEVV